jgi:hypothetical protein
VRVRVFEANASGTGSFARVSADRSCGATAFRCLMAGAADVTFLEALT